MTELLSEFADLKPLSIKSTGRSHLACVRCRTQKIKCSGDHPTCRNCAVSHKQCNYPARQRKVVIMESQLSKIRSRLNFLEKEVIRLKRGGSDELPITAKKSKLGNPEESDETQDQDFVNPLSTKFTSESYFGTSSCQVFDIALHSFLDEFTSDAPEHTMSHQSRYFFQDPTVNLPFSGVLMLPDRTYAHFLVKKVVDFIGHEFYLFDTRDFLRRIDETYESLRDKKPSWLCYFFITLAVGEQYLNESPDGGPPGMRFFVPAMQLFRHYYETPTVEFVQTLLLIGFYQQNLNRTNTVFSFYGMATRSALLLGLHRKVTDPSFSAVEKEKRARVWWTAFLMESVWCAKLGQPIHVSVEDVNLDISGADSVALGDGFNTELLYSNAKLAVIVGKIMKKIYRPTDDGSPSKLTDIFECLTDLDNFQKDLSPKIKSDLLVSQYRSAANLYLRINQIVIITTRPLVLSIFKGLVEQTEKTKQVTTQCIKAAKLNLDILKNLKTNGWLCTFGFWDAQYCFSSLLILTMANISGHSFPQILSGREINAHMSEAGNFIAKENEMRLRELDELLRRINKKSMKSRHGSLSSDIEPEIISSNSQSEESRNNTMTSLNGHDYSSLLNKITDNLTQVTTEPFEQVTAQTKFNAYDPTGTLNPEPLSLGLPSAGFADLDLSNFETFRNGLSPDAWNNLATSFQFWDSSAFPMSSNDLFYDQ